MSIYHRCCSSSGRLSSIKIKEAAQPKSAATKIIINQRRSSRNTVFLGFFECNLRASSLLMVFKMSELGAIASHAPMLWQIK